MKSKIILISIIFLAVCLISPAAADDSQIAGEINVTYNDTVYEKDLGYIDVELPQNASGNIKGTINHAEFYNQNISSSVKIPIIIPKSAVSLIAVNRNTDHITYGINLFFNNITILNSTLKVMKVPSNYSVAGFAEEILKDDPKGHVSVYMPESAKGEMKIYIDGEFAMNFTSMQYNFINITKFNSLELGGHNVTVVYEGDRYYKKFNKTFNFTVVDMLIHIPKNVVLDHDDCISARILNNTDGIVTVYVDNQPVFKDKLDKYGEFLHSLFRDVTCGEHLIEVEYNASKFTKSKKVLVNVSYYVDMFMWGAFSYGDDNKIVFIVLEDFNKSLINITVDGIRYTNFEIDNSGWIELDISKLDAGNHTVKFNFTGDKKYYGYYLEDNFTVQYRIMVPYDFWDSKVDVSLTLPKSASGNLEVYIDSKLYKTVKLTKGKAHVTINNLIPGRYNLSVKYTGDDFNVSDVSEIVEICPDITTPGEMYFGQDKSIVVKTQKSAKGKVIFTVEGKNITVNLKDGKAVLSLKNFKAGYYDDIDVLYVGDNGFNATLYTAVDILHATVKLKNVKTTSESVKAKVYINSKLVKNAYVTFKVDGKTKKVKTDKNGVATIKLAAGKHTISAVYKNSKAIRSVTVHVITLKTVTVKKSAKKVVLSAKLKKGKTLLKNKVVKFRFNGKTIKVKTNRKGIAKATFKTSSLKVAKKVSYSASYAKDSVQKTAVVKK